MTTASDLRDALDQLDDARAELSRLPTTAPEALSGILRMGADLAAAAVDGIERALPPDVVARAHRERNPQEAP